MSGQFYTYIGPYLKISYWPNEEEFDIKEELPDNISFKFQIFGELYVIRKERTNSILINGDIIEITLPALREDFWETKNHFNSVIKYFDEYGFVYEKKIGVFTYEI